jgi:hypothetical protein
MGEEYVAYMGKKEIHTKNLKESDHFEDLEINRSVWPGVM